QQRTLLAPSAQGNRVEHFIVGLVCRPSDRRRHLLVVPPHRFDERGQLLRGSRAAAPARPGCWIHEQLGRKVFSAVLIKERAHARWQFKTGEKALVEPPAADHVDRMFTYTSATHCK